MRSTLAVLLLSRLFVADRVPATAEAASSRPLTLDDLTIVLEQTECFGTCPVYKVTLEGLGLVTYEGYKHVDAVGIHVSEVPAEQIVALADEMVRIYFFDLRDEYVDIPGLRLDGRHIRSIGTFVSDDPSTILTLRLGDRRKRIVLYQNVPMELSALAERIRQTSGAAKLARGER